MEDFTRRCPEMSSKNINYLFIDLLTTARIGGERRAEGQAFDSSIKIIIIIIEENGFFFFIRIRLIDERPQEIGKDSRNSIAASNYGLSVNIIN